jgi:hypothetical protein
MISAKLFVSAGALAQFNGGDTFSPTQFGLALLAPAFLTASGVPSLKAGEVRENGSADAIPPNNTTPAAAAST